MKFTLVVFVALGLTVAWQASVVADNKQQQVGPSPASQQQLSDNIGISRAKRG